MADDDTISTASNVSIESAGPPTFCSFLKTQRKVFELNYQSKRHDSCHKKISIPRNTQKYDYCKDVDY